MKSIRLVLAAVLAVLAFLATAHASITVTFGSVADVGATASSYTASGTATFALGFVPEAGTELTVVKNTGLGFISGTFSNLAQGQSVSMSYGGVTYEYVANYYGGTGNDLVLVWKNNRLLAWGDNHRGKLGNNSTAQCNVPTGVLTNGVLSGKTVVSVAAGYGHSMALCSDGTLAAWGWNGYGQFGNNSETDSFVPVLVNTTGALTGKKVIAIAAGEEHSLALCSDGTMATWGDNHDGQLGNNSTAFYSTVPVAVSTSGVLSGKTVVAIVAGSRHNVALCSDGTVAAWGKNDVGQLGNNSTINSSVPVAVSTSGALSGKTVVSVAAGNGHSMALCSDGTVATWGRNDFGQLGNNSTTDRYVPVAVLTSGVLSGKTVVAVTAGDRHSMAVCSDGTVAAWGRNTYGLLGNNSTADSSVPVALTTNDALAGRMVVAVAAGANHSLARCMDGTLAAWGNNYYGMLGNKSTTQSNVAVAVYTGTLTAGERFTKAISGSSAVHTLALAAAAPSVGSLTATYTSANDVPVTASNPFLSGGTVTLALGFMPRAGTELTVVKNSGIGFIGGAFSNLAQGQTVLLSYGGVTYEFVANYYGGTGNDLVLVWKNNRLLAWGNNGNGQLGNNSTTQGNVPAEVLTSGVLAGKMVVDVAAGASHSVALCSDGTVAAWGKNDNGQLGNNSTTDSSVPVTVSTSGVLAGKTVVAVAVGAGNSMALCSDGTVAAWGNNDFGQLGNNSTAPSIVPVAVATSGVLSGKTVVAVATGGNHCAALCSDGTVAAWGNNSNGQLGNNSTAQSNFPVAVSMSGVLAGKLVVAVATGGNHCTALCSDGTVAAWGNNAYGQLGNNSTTNSSVPVAVSTSGVLSGKKAVSVAAGGSHSMALCMDGTLTAWGRNDFGQLGNNSTTNSSVPVVVSASGVLSGMTVVAVAAGQYHSLALCLDGTLATWGSNGNGQLGNNSTTNSSVPVVVSTGTLAVGERLIKAVSDQSAYHTLALAAAAPSVGNLTATFTSANDVPVTALNPNLSGGIATISLGYTPVPGTELTVVKNAGLGFITGNFGNLTQGQSVPLSYGGVTYEFVADYYGGTGNDLVLVWKNTRPLAWGRNSNGQLGNNSTSNSLVPAGVLTNGALSGKTVVAISAGNAHSIALCSDGTVAAWGKNSNGQLGNNSTTQSNVPVAVNTSGALAGKMVVAVSAGNAHSLALCSDGSVVAWGINGTGQLGNNSTTQSNVPVAVNMSGVLAGKMVVAVAAGNAHSLALCSDGTLVAWGNNSNSELGNGTTANSSVPVVVSRSTVLSGKTVVAVAAGGNHSVALCSDGMVAAWGYNGYGQLGNNSGTNSNVPVAVSTSGVLSGKMVVSVAAGATHSMALCSDGTLAAWGWNSTGQLGNNSTADSRVPVAVSMTGVLSGKSVVSVAAGFQHSLALCSDGTVAAWGYNADGELGNNSTAQSNVPVALSTSTLAVGERFTMASSGSIGYHTMALVAAPPVIAPAVTYTSASDVPVSASNPILSGGTATLSLGYAPVPGTELMVVRNTGLGFISGTFNNLAHGQSVSLNYGGLMYEFVANYYGGSGNDLVLVWKNTRPLAWGWNSTGQLGNNSTTDSSVPTAVLTSGALSGKTLLSIAAGAQHSVALCSDGTVAAWGRNQFGQLGNNSTADSTVPVAVGTDGVLFGKTVVAVAAGGYHSLALCSDGTVAAWGVNAEGELGNNSTTYSSSVPVAVLTDGVLSGKTVVAVAAGDWHSLVLCSDGTVAAWGYNNNGQLGNNSTVNSSVPVAVSTSGVLTGKKVVAVAGGGSHSVALCSDSTLAAWGLNDSGQLGNNSTVNSGVPVAVSTGGVLSGKTLVSVSAGEYHSMALCSDGTAAAWGRNESGQLGNNSTANSSVPVAVDTSGVFSGKTVVSIAAGLFHSMARCSDGTVAEWGNNSYGQLGNSTTWSSVPVVVGTGMLAAGERFTEGVTGSMANHTLALVAAPPSVANLTATFTSASDVALTLSPPLPVVIGTGRTATISLGYAPSVGTELTVVKNTGLGFVSGTFSNLAQGQSVSLGYGGRTYEFVANYYGGTGNDLVLVWKNNRPMAWGRNQFGALGNNSTTDSSMPTAVLTSGLLSGKTIVSVARGREHSLALCSDGTVAVWGRNISGQLGNNSTTNSLVPTGVFTNGVLSGKTVVSVATCYDHSMALCSDGTVAAWGSNGNGQLGNNSTTQSKVPIGVLTSGVLSGKVVVAIAAGGAHSVALCSDGTLAAWGANNSGQLGNNSTTQSNVPVAVNMSGVLSGKTVVAVAAGYAHSMALCSDGTVATWGQNDVGQLGNNSTTISSVPVAVSMSGTLSGKMVVSIAAGSFHSVVLCSDGTVAAWGSNNYGQLGNNSTANSSVPVAVSTSGVLAGKTAVAVSAGSSYSEVLCSDGTASAWGLNSNGQLGNNSTSSSSVPVAVSTSTLAVGERFTKAASGAMGQHALTLVAVPPMTALEIWRSQYFGTTANSGNAADAADPDGDGLRNILEWACGSNPTIGNKSPGSMVLNGAYLEFTYSRAVPAVNAGATFAVKWSDTLAAGTWSAAGVSETILTDNGVLQQVKALVPTGNGGRRFVRLEVTAPAP